MLCGLLDGLDALGDVGAIVGRAAVPRRRRCRSAAYRQRCADLAGAAITVPDTDETVATGAAVQAAAIASGEQLDAVAERWWLGRGTVVEPRNDASAVRVRYAAARAAYASH